MLKYVNGGEKATFKKTTELCTKNLKISHLLRAESNKKGLKGLGYKIRRLNELAWNQQRTSTKYKKSLNSEAAPPKSHWLKSVYMVKKF